MSQEPQTILGAVVAVPHDPDCANRAGYERQGAGCACRTRDARIAKGIEAALEAFGADYGTRDDLQRGPDELYPEAVAAFIRVTAEAPTP
jgi:hypothetical protein